MYTYRPTGVFLSYNSYFTFHENPNLEAFGAQFMSEDNRTTFAAISVKATNPRQSQHVTSFVDDRVRKLHGGSKSFSVKLTGVPAFVADAQAGVEHDMTRTDSGALVLSMAVLAYIIRSLRLIVLPLLCIGFSIALSFTIMYFVATNGMDVISVTPSMMMSVRW
jgi:predicted RND superfamily exporter protein